MTPLRLILLSILSISSIYVHAQHPPLTLQDCIKRAYTKNLQIRQQEIDTLETLTMLKKARSEYLPYIVATGGQSLDLGRSLDKTGVMQDRSSTGGQFGLSLSYEIFSGLRRPYTLKASSLSHQASVESLKQTYLDVTISVTQLFYNLLYASEMRRIAEAQLEETKGWLSRAEALVKSGKWSDLKLAELQTQYAQEELALIDAQNNYELARLDLMQYIEWETSASPALEITTNDIDQQVKQAQITLLLEKDIIESATKNSPAVKSTQLRIQNAEQQIHIAKSGFFPSISLNAGYTNSYYHLIDRDLKELNLPLSTQLRDNGRYYVGLSIQIPIFDRNTTRYAVSSARNRVHLAQLEHQQAIRKLHKEVTQALQSVTAAQRKITAAEYALKQAQLSMHQTQKALELGRVSTYEYTQAKTKELQSQIEHMRAKYDFVYKVHLLHYYLNPHLYSTP